MLKKAVIISLSGYNLTKNELKLFRNYKPWGVILFKRNIKNYFQTKKLIDTVKKITKDKKYPILIDEEGGTVSRLSNIIDNKIFSQRFFGKVYEVNNDIGLSLYEHYINKINFILKDIGINMNTIPVVDKLYNKTNNFLKDRIYSSKIKTINSLSKVCVKIHKNNKIGTVIKHIPGHGLSRSDSHKKLPVIKESLNFLLKNDFKCFRKTNSLFAMTGHILFDKLDKTNCSTHSKKIINDIIRKKIGFKGIIISDDINMKSLKYGFLENALQALAAGCNLALYCRGNYKDSLKLLKNIPPIDAFTLKKTSEFYKFLG